MHLHPVRVPTDTTKQWFRLKHTSSEAGCRPKYHWGKVRMRLLARASVARDRCLFVIILFEDMCEARTARFEQGISVAVVLLNIEIVIKGLIILWHGPTFYLQTSQLPFYPFMSRFTSTFNG